MSRPSPKSPLTLVICGSGAAGRTIAGDCGQDRLRVGVRDHRRGGSRGRRRRASDHRPRHVPMVRLGAALGIELPVTRDMVDVMGAMLEHDYWAEGLQLADLGLDGLDAEGIRRYVTTGRV
jgi:hypothetical protein